MGRAYDLFRRRQCDGIWKQIFVQLQAEVDAKGLIAWDVSVDSTIARAHQHASGAVQGAEHNEPPGGVETESDDHGPGRSRRGPQFQRLLEAIRAPPPRPGLVAHPAGQGLRCRNRKKRGSRGGRPPEFDKADYSATRVVTLRVHSGRLIPPPTA